MIMLLATLDFVKSAEVLSKILVNTGRGQATIFPAMWYGIYRRT
jgi:hypothetical protein